MNFVPLHSIHAENVMLVNVEHVYVMTDAKATANIGLIKAGESYTILKFASGYTLEVGESSVEILRMLQAADSKQ